MARASSAGENAATNGLTAVCTFTAIFTADPTTSGASGEVAGGSYARQATVFGSSSAGAAANTGALTVPIPSSTTVPYFGEFNASTAGTYEVGGALSSSITFVTAGNLSIAIGALSISSS